MDQQGQKTKEKIGQPQGRPGSISTYAAVVSSNQLDTATVLSTHHATQLAPMRAPALRTLDDIQDAGTAPKTRMQGETSDRLPVEVKLHLKTQLDVSTLTYLERQVQVKAAREGLLATLTPPYYAADNQLFVERSSIQNQLNDLFSQSAMAASQASLTAMQGLGGIGKSQLAAHYFYHSQKNYTQRFWLIATTREILAQQMQQLAIGLGLIAADDRHGPDIILKMVKCYLARQQSYILVVFDDVTRYADIRDYLNLPGCDCLLTSRNSMPQPGIVALNVDVMKKEEAQVLIRRHAPATVATSLELEVLVETLGCLPLALAQAGAYLQVMGCSISDYLTLFQEEEICLLSQGHLKSNVDKREHQPVQVTWLLNKKRLSQRCPAAITLLEYSAWLSDKGIPQALLQTLAEQETKDFCATKVALKEFSLMGFDDKKQNAQIHQLVQRVVRQGITTEACQSQLQSLALYLLKNHPHPMRRVEDYEHARQLLPHLNKVLHNWEQQLGSLETLSSQSELPLSFRLLQAIAHSQRKLGDAKQHTVLLQRILSIKKRYYGHEHLEVADTLGWLADALQTLGDAAGAKATVEQVLRIEEQHYSSDDPRLAKSLGQLGNALRALGDAAGAKKHLERALVIEERCYGPDHPVVANWLGVLSQALYSLGDTAEAKAHLERALVIEERYYGSEHPKVAKTLADLGNYLDEVGDEVGAKARLEQALVILERHFGSEHPSVARALGNLAILQRGDPAGAKARLERALEILERYYGPDHPTVASMLANLGNALYGLGDLTSARTHLEQALAINEHYYGPEHPEVAKILSGLGMQGLADAASAKVYLERALRIQERHFGLRHLRVAKTLENLGNALNDLNDVAGAKATLERALVIVESCYGSEHRRVAWVLTIMGKVLILGDAAGAKMCLQRALGILERYYFHNPEHPEIALTRFILAQAYEKLGDLAAIPAAQRAYNVMMQARGFGPTHPNTRKMACYLASIQPSAQLVSTLTLAERWQAFLMACKNGHIESVNFLLHQPEIDPTIITTPTGQSPLLVALLTRQTAIVHRLLTVLKCDEATITTCQAYLQGSLDFTHSLSDNQRYYTAVTKIAPHFRTGWHNLGCCYNAQGLLAEANSAYQRALQLNPTQSIRCEYANFLLATGNSCASIHDPIALLLSILSEPPSGPGLTYSQLEVNNLASSPLLQKELDHYQTFGLDPHTLATWLLLIQPLTTETCYRLPVSDRHTWLTVFTQRLHTTAPKHEIAWVLCGHLHKQYHQFTQAKECFVNARCPSPSTRETLAECIAQRTSIDLTAEPASLLTHCFQAQHQNVNLPVVTTTEACLSNSLVGEMSPKADRPMNDSDGLVSKFSSSISQILLSPSKDNNSYSNQTAVNNYQRGKVNKQLKGLLSKLTTCDLNDENISSEVELAYLKYLSERADRDSSYHIVYTKESFEEFLNGSELPAEWISMCKNKLGF